MSWIMSVAIVTNMTFFAKNVRKNLLPWQLQAISSVKIVFQCTLYIHLFKAAVLNFVLKPNKRPVFRLVFLLLALKDKK